MFCVCVPLYPLDCSFFMYVFMVSGLSLLMFILHYVYTTVRKVRVCLCECAWLCVCVRGCVCVCVCVYVKDFRCLDLCYFFSWNAH